MTPPQPTHAPPRRVWAQKKMVTLALLGFASGLPLFLTSRTLDAWLRLEGIELATIGFFSILSLPYSLKFLVAPLMDRYVPPFLGRRRGWLVITQLALLVVIAAMALQDPRRSLQMLAFNAFLIALFSASQDVVGDAYRTDVVAEREMGAAAAVWVVGYRVALLITASVAFILADHMPWPMVYVAMSGLMLIGVAAAFWAPEPRLDDAPPRTFTDAVVLPFRDFFRRAGLATGILVLLFIVLYRLPDALTLRMATPFLIDLGFSQTELGAIYGGVGIGATIAGAFGAGTLVARLGLNRAMWIAGGLQAASNLGYFALTIEASQPVLVTAVVIENFCNGLTGSVFVAFMMSLSSVRFSATQYALLSSLTGVARDLVGGAPSGLLAEATGWPTFFLLSIVAGIPGLLMLPKFVPWNREMPPMAADHSGATES